MVGQKRTRRLPVGLKIVRGIALLGLLIIAVGGITVTFFPDVAAQNVDRLRNIIGDETVAQIETFVLNVQDQAQQLAYQLGLSHPAAAWTPPPNDAALISLQPPIASAAALTHSASPLIAQRLTTVPDAPPTAASTVVALTSTPAVTLEGKVPVIASFVAVTAPITLPSIVPTIPPTIAPTATPLLVSSTPPVTSAAPISQVSTVIPVATTAAHAWQLAPLTPFGSMAGEGQWQPYMLAADGRTVVAYRTFLQPDPQRPYTLPAIVAINLQVTRLHFVLGTVDPAPATPQPSRTGVIPAADKQPGVLLATFNGGFKARHGHYGAMADGLIGLPALAGDATVAIYSNGSVRIGQWGTDITDSPDLVAWRQNGKMLIRNGQINPATAQTTVSWGLTIQGNAVTWRSALGLSADGQTLYYIGGPHLDVPALTRAMAQTGAANALQLDVNYFWVHFAAIRSDGNQLSAEPLTSDMTQKVDRYLKVSTDDFFYVTQ